MNFEKMGKIKIIRFDELDEKQLNRRRNMILGAIKRFNLIKREHPLSTFVPQMFPEIWAEAILTQSDAP